MDHNHIQPFDESGDLNVIVDTPKGSRNKYSFDEELGVFKLSGVLAAGHVFPYDFGFIPGTLGGDGDPLDVLILMDEPAFVGCLIHVRLLGAIEAEQTERDGNTTRNDRLIGVAAKSPTHEHLSSINDIDKTVVDEIEHFFVSYNYAKGKKFVPLNRSDQNKAREIVERSKPPDK
jgi:inorganic pyrophosphatase